MKRTSPAVAVADPATDQEIDRKVEWLDEKDYPGLPIVWIEDQGLRAPRPSAPSAPPAYE